MTRTNTRSAGFLLLLLAAAAVLLGGLREGRVWLAWSANVGFRVKLAPSRPDYCSWPWRSGDNWYLSLAPPLISSVRMRPLFYLATV